MSGKIEKDSVYDITIRLFIISLIIAWCFLIFYPFANILLWSFILSLSLHPLHAGLTKRLKGKRKLASFILVFSILIIIFIPVAFITGSLINEIKELKLMYDKGTLKIPHPDEKIKEWPVIGEKLYYAWQSSTENLQHTAEKHKEQIIEYGGKAVRGILSSTGALFQIILSLIIAGAILVKGGAGEAIRKVLRKIAGNNGDKFADLIYNTVGSVLKGVLGESFVMAVLFGIVFFLAGIPYAGILTFLVFLISVLQLPLILISLPVLIYIFSANETTPAIIWGIAILLVSLSNNILTPLMLGKGAPVPMPVIFIGVLGGFMLSGFIGLFTGAIVLSLGYTLFTEWVNSNDDRI